MALKRTIKYVDVHVDGRGYLGQADSVVPPVLAVMTKDIRAGLDAPVKADMGIEPLVCELNFRGLDGALCEQWGVTGGAVVPATLYAAQQDEDGNTEQIRIDIRGKIHGLNTGQLKTGEIAECKFTIDCEYYKLAVAGKERVMVDIPNFIRRVNGVDQLAEIRRALGRSA